MRLRSRKEDPFRWPRRSFFSCIMFPSSSSICLLVPTTRQVQAEKQGQSFIRIDQRPIVGNGRNSLGGNFRGNIRMHSTKEGHPTTVRCVLFCFCYWCTFPKPLIYRTFRAAACDTDSLSAGMMSTLYFWLQDLGGEFVGRQAHECVGLSQLPHPVCVD